jgi:hypothetical protein
MAVPKCAFAVVRRLASGSGPPWSFTFTGSLHPLFGLGCSRGPCMPARRMGAARGSAL